MQTFRTLVIGGSNTVVRDGYLTNMIRTCAAQGIDIQLAHDLSVGNTTIGYGLYRIASNLDVLKNVDLVIIEYALNDEFIYGGDLNSLRHWARLYEGCLRAVREANPNVAIFSVILARRTGHFVDRVPYINASIAYLSEWYGTGYIDVARHSAERYGYAVARSEKFYMPDDAAHYANPVVTAAIGALIGETLTNYLASGAYLTRTSLPMAVDPGHFAEAHPLALPTLAAGLKTEPVVHSNWRFRAEGVDLSRRKLTISVEAGRLLGIEYLCMANTGPLYFEHEGRHFRAGTMKGGVQDGKFKLLISWLPLEFLHGNASDKAGVATYTISTEPLATTAPVSISPRDGIKQAEEKLVDDTAFLISGLLYQGTGLTVSYGGGAEPALLAGLSAP